MNDRNYFPQTPVRAESRVARPQAAARRACRHVPTVQLTQGSLARAGPSGSAGCGFCRGHSPCCLGLSPLAAQPVVPSVVDTNLAVRTVVTNLDQPIAMAFLGQNDFLVTEKASGKVKRVVDGVVTATVLDLPVNSASERGLLGMALHPDFKRNRLVYLYWTESSTGADSTVAG